MKKNTHPPYQEVLFEDTSTGDKFVCGSTLQPTETATFEGKEYPIYRVPISSASHPFFTGSKQFVDTQGRIGKFQQRYAMKKQQQQKDLQKQEEKIEDKKKKKTPGRRKKQV